MSDKDVLSKVSTNEIDPNTVDLASLDPTGFTLQIGVRLVGQDALDFLRFKKGLQIEGNAAGATASIKLGLKTPQGLAAIKGSNRYDQEVRPVKIKKGARKGAAKGEA